MHLDKIPASLKTGQEPLTYKGNPVGATILDFWRWSTSDLLSNATRGRFAEFIVATATGMDKTIPRDEWSTYDLETPDGIKLEIKSAAYIQSWAQKALSKISFRIKLSRSWDLQTLSYDTEKKRHADVYVFCLLYHDNKQTIDPLDMDHWAFYVLSTPELDAWSRHRSTITLKILHQLTEQVSYCRLDACIRERFQQGCKPTDQ